MSRQDDLREVMRGLVAPEPDNRTNTPRIERRKNSAPTGAALPFSPRQAQILNELRSQLNENGITANETEIALALLEGLARRPSLCRGLLAEFLSTK